jgi:hypothetical protein
MYSMQEICLWTLSFNTEYKTFVASLSTRARGSTVHPDRSIERKKAMGKLTQKSEGKLVTDFVDLFLHPISSRPGGLMPNFRDGVASIYHSRAQRQKP